MSSDFQSKTFIFLERLWLFGVIVAICLVVYFLINKDNDSALFFFGFFILAALIYLMRKRQRVKHQAFLKHKEEEQKK
jgi:uncharacterized membrane protein YfcA